MSDLVYLKNTEAMTDSLTVADSFGKRHDVVLRKIQSLIEDDSTQNCGECFTKTKYKDASGKWNTKYLMNRDGFSFLVMGFTGKKANEWKWNYINAFNTMETVIRERGTTTWLETRQYGKLTRKAETDTIQKLVEYAKGQGSEHAEMLYMTYSKLANKMAGVTKRDEATVRQLNNLSDMENIILNVIELGIIENKGYKEIYQECKERLLKFKDVAFLQSA